MQPICNTSLSQGTLLRKYPRLGWLWEGWRLWGAALYLKMTQLGKRYAALTFDCYGTLIDWESGILASLQPFLTSKGVFESDEALLELYAQFEPAAESGPFKIYKKVLQECMRSFARHFGFTLEEGEEDLLALGIQAWKPFPDTVYALSLLSAHFRLCILSNIDEDLIRWSQQWLEVPFYQVVTAEQVGSYKPSPRHFHEIQKRLGIGAAQILHVAGSQYHDIAPAKALGFDTVWVNRRQGLLGSGATPASEAQATYNVHNLKELVALLSI
jgi:2-haloacid dehalogenase